MPDESSGPVDVAVLRSIQTDLAKVDLTDTVTFHPSATDPRRVDAVLDEHQYPPTVEEARLECRWHTNGDFGVHYVESHRDGRQWQCRWDRHRNPHDGRLHFHPPPGAGDPVDLDASPYVRDVLPMVLRWVEERIEELW